MLLFNVYVFFTLACVTFISIIMANRFKSGMNLMSGMIVTMFFGMNAGITSGILLGSIHQGDLFLSTMLGMVIGAFCGVGLGFVFSTASSIEGFMSGLMGGMMGAMLGEMLLPEKALILIQFFLTLTVSSIFLYKILQQTKSAIKSSRDVIIPFLSFILLASYLLTGNLLGNAWIENIEQKSEDQQHLHHP